MPLLKTTVPPVRPKRISLTSRLVSVERSARDSGERDAALVAELGAVEHVAGAGENRAGGADVHAIRTADVGLVVVDELEVMLLGEVVVQAGGGEAAVVAALALEIQVVAVVVGVGGDAALQTGRAVGQGCDLVEASAAMIGSGVETKPLAPASW